MDRWTIAILGDGGVGKTALTIQTYDPTLEDSYRKQLLIDNRMCLVEIFDTAGQEEYATLRDQWIREGKGFVLVYSITSQDSFNRLHMFCQAVYRIKCGNAVLMLVGNKCDRDFEREVSREQGVALAKQLGCEFFETSAKNTQNVACVFEDLVRVLRGDHQVTRNNNNENLFSRLMRHVAGFLIGFFHGCVV